MKNEWKIKFIYKFQTVVCFVLRRTEKKPSNRMRLNGCNVRKLCAEQVTLAKKNAPQRTSIKEYGLSVGMLLICSEANEFKMCSFDDFAPLCANCETNFEK